MLIKTESYIVKIRISIIRCTNLFVLFLQVGFRVPRCNAVPSFPVRTPLISPLTVNNNG